MMARARFLGLIPLVVLFAIGAQAATKEVVVLGTVHGDHNRFPLYNLDSIRIAIEHTAPDLIIIEEDPKTFAEKWYETLTEEEYNKRRPIEIRRVVMPYALKHGLKAIPVDDRNEYDTKIAPLEAKLNEKLKDPESKRAVEALLKGYESLFLDDYLKKTLYDFHSDTFMSVIEQYQELARQNPITKEVQAVSDRRQARIDANIVAALRKEKFKRALIVYGVTHRPAIVRAPRNSQVATVLSLEQAMKPKIPGVFERTGSMFLAN